LSPHRTPPVTRDAASLQNQWRFVERAAYSLQFPFPTHHTRKLKERRDRIKRRDQDCKARQVSRRKKETSCLLH
jgi:hypothetical protein